MQRWLCNATMLLCPCLFSILGKLATTFLRKELLRRERKCESGSGVLPVALEEPDNDQGPSSQPALQLPR